QKSFLRLEWPREDDAHRLAIRPVNTENPGPIGRHSHIEIPRLRREPRRIRHEPHHERVLERLLHLLDIEGVVQVKGGISPIKVHNPNAEIADIYPRSTQMCLSRKSFDD